MNKPKKKAVEVLKYVRVKVKIRGVACEPQPEPEPEPIEPPAPAVPVSLYDADIAYAEAKVAWHEEFGRTFRDIIRRAGLGEKHCRARMNALRRVPKQLSRKARRVLLRERESERSQMQQDLVWYGKIKQEAMLEGMTNDHVTSVYQKLRAELKLDRYEGKPRRTVLVSATDWYNGKVVYIK